MRIQVNGEEHDIVDGSSLATVLEELGRTHRGVAVALDGQVVRRGDWAEIVPGDGARLDVFTAVQGG